MQILRLPPYPLSVTYTVPEANTEYILVIEDVAEQTEIEEQVTSNATFQVTYSLTGDFVKYDKSYALSIYEDSGASGPDIERGDIVVEDNLEVVRPYVNPTTLATSGTATDIAAYTEYENLARTIIDSITGGFYYNRTYLEVVGQGTDYVPLWKKTHKILKAYENSLLVYDATLEEPILGEWSYELTKDKTAIMKNTATPGLIGNRSEQKGLNLHVAPSDSFNVYDTDYSENAYTFSTGAAFPEGWDYLFLLETGYKVVPHDIYEAALMLIEDIKCGKIDYYKRYVTSYNTDQFKIQFDKMSFDGTGNMIVDKILQKYQKSITKIGII